MLIYIAFAVGILVAWFYIFFGYFIFRRFVSKPEQNSKFQTRYKGSVDRVWFQKSVLENDTILAVVNDSHWIADQSVIFVIEPNVDFNKHAL